MTRTSPAGARHAQVVAWLKSVTWCTSMPVHAQHVNLRIVRQAARGRAGKREREGGREREIERERERRERDKKENVIAWLKSVT